MIEVGPVTLQGQWVRLAPLEQRHAGDLAAVATDREVWQYLLAPLATPADVELFVERALAAAERGEEVPFVTVDCATETVVGTTRFMDIRREHHAVEIGNTLLGRAWWRTVLNSEAKYLLMRHLFDTIGCQRVSLKTDRLNERSQRAIERLGAVREGVLRKHMIVQNGRPRDTVYYSIVDEEWPAIKARMEESLYGGRENRS